MFRIGEFSKMSKTTIKALRYYDEIGLLKPEVTDEFTSYRFYTTNQLVKLHKIQSLRQIGLAIDEVKRIMAGCDASAILEARKRNFSPSSRTAALNLARLNFCAGEKRRKTL